MRLHEAIRLGAMSCPQAFGLTVTVSGARCALGAAALARGLSKNWLSVCYVWPWLVSETVKCPECVHFRNAFRMVMHLNDEHRWTREAIADWLEPLELAFEAQQQPSTRIEAHA